MEQITVMFSLPEPTLKALHEIAESDGVAVESLLQNAVSRDVEVRNQRAKSAHVEVEVVALLRAILIDDFTFARGWKDLQRRLRNKGYTLKMNDSTLALHRYACGAHLCDIAELGKNYARLMRRFWAPFPDYSNNHMPTRIFG